MRCAIQNHHCFEWMKNKKKSYLRECLPFKRKKNNNNLEQMKKRTVVFFRLWNVWAWADIKSERPFKGETVNRTRTDVEGKKRIVTDYQKPLFDVWLHRNTFSVSFVFLSWSLIFWLAIAIRKTNNKFNSNKYASELKMSTRCLVNPLAMRFCLAVIVCTMCDDTEQNDSYRIESKKRKKMRCEIENIVCFYLKLNSLDCYWTNENETRRHTLINSLFIFQAQYLNIDRFRRSTSVRSDVTTNVTLTCCSKVRPCLLTATNNNNNNIIQ